MRITSFCLLTATIYLFISFIALKPIGVFQGSLDIGKPKLASSSTYNDVTKEYRLSGSGYNIWFARDEFRFLFKKMVGDFTITADDPFWKMLIVCPILKINGPPWWLSVLR